MFKVLAPQFIKFPSYQQVRFSRKTFRLRYAYGEEPLVTDDEYMATLEENGLNALSYKKIRFASIKENSSPLFDRDYDRFTNYIMRDGRKGMAEKLMHETFYNIKCIQYARYIKKNLDSSKDDEDKEEIELNPMTIFKSATRNCEPVVITKKIKRGGATYLVPFPLHRSQSEYYSIKWLIKSVIDRPRPKKRLFHDVMASELMDAFNNRGKVVKMKDDMHKQAEANKAYAHYRWG